MRKYLIVIFLGLTSVGVSQPKWITETPPGYLNDYYVASGTSNKSESEARQIAFGNILFEIFKSGKVDIKASRTFSDSALELFHNLKSLSLDVVSKIESESKLSGESQTIKGLREEETFVEFRDGLYTVWLLAKVPKRDPKPYSEPSPFSPVWRSAIAPSWGQFYKGQSGKGYVIAISEAVLIPAGFILGNLKATNETDAQNSRTQVLRDYYNDQANTYSNLSLGCFILAGAVYVYNVVDALVSTGEKEYVENGQHLKPDLFVSSQGVRIEMSLTF